MPHQRLSTLILAVKLAAILLGFLIVWGGLTTFLGPVPVFFVAFAFLVLVMYLMLHLVAKWREQFAAESLPCQGHVSWFPADSEVVQQDEENADASTV